MRVFTFGSNLSGRHGAGAALEAVQHWGAIYGQGFGLRGRSYAIPTKDEYLKTLGLDQIQAFVEHFIEFVVSHPEDQFEVTAIGCGLAGYEPSQIAPMFEAASDNCILPPSFKPYMTGTHLFRATDKVKR